MTTGFDVTKRKLIKNPNFISLKKRNFHENNFSFIFFSNQTDLIHIKNWSLQKSKKEKKKKLSPDRDWRADWYLLEAEESRALHESASIAPPF
jgi:hypothetical protein